ncbi:MAG: sigma-70 family RNA polymerase sigma factor [Chloroflexi bacterium]|nr:sigma-70 family RNA polymerase sigma factor [Chloroflexota bacterium]
MSEQDVHEWRDQERVRAAQADPAAFGAIYEHYVDRIYSYIYHRVGNAHDAEDLTSRTFFRAFAHLDEYQDKGFAFSAWLYRIAHNLVANWYRDSKRRQMVALDELVIQSDPKLHPEQVATDSDEARLLNELVATLDSTRQELLYLKFHEGLSNAEVGRVMGRTEGAIKSLYHRTLLQLRREMENRGIQADEK